MTTTNVGDRLGVTHAGGCYNPRTDGFLVGGAEEILTLGSRVIKLWFDGNPHRFYRFDPLWGMHTTLVSQAKHPRFEEVFAKPFTTIVLEAFRPSAEAGYWQHRLTDDDEAAEVDEFRELTTHLRQRWHGTGKTFVLQNWEGDWAVRAHFDRDRMATPEQLERFRRWMTARQRGVEAGRVATPDSDVKVWNAAEVNLVQSAMEGHPELTTEVLPKLRCDLYSYSVWDPPGANGEIVKRLAFIAEHCEPSEAFGRKNIMLGEFGVPELATSLGVTPEQAAQRSADLARQALAWGCPYVIYWELYDNEAERQPSGAMGVWLIRPDGSKAPSYHALHEVLHG